ncbi:MAG: hypothetical protein AAF293_01045 [Pseudomonadota bacterium]
MAWQENWLWDSNDDMVRDFLTGGEIASVKKWQTSGEFTFEFHGGHTTGDPVYVRPTGNTDNSNIPKFDTAEKFAHQYGTMFDFANDGKLRAALSGPAQDELLGLLRDEWDTIKLVATRYWNDESVNDARKSTSELWAEEETSDTGQHNTVISKDLLRKILGAQ